ncbi:hypothetical protein Lesp02_21570 [Lentzea sp. NBRC 105346]|uniref:hypothetical protein n=1 Tax=Lentzea sp. NBRC 105346 TaxID=3032205 RepID=UPI0024A36A51|nr:hypothetical protein [Lentzea sp. NBRC 105346]GLZ29967.1 hypothetical protein Lesp02_21570 [Lentzea sp. NBRC 105346]
MRAFLTVLSAALLAFLAAPQASASPVFLSATASTPTDSGALQVSFKIGGLIVGTTVTVKTTAKMTAVYACQNEGGNFPSDPKKTQVVSSVAAAGTFKVDLLGQVAGTLTINPPTPTLRCPKGQHVVLVSMSYGEVSVVSGGVTQSISGVFSRVYLDI